MPTVSIILPTYNRAKFLPQAISSIRSQSHVDWELIVVDDGSTDDTQKLISELTDSIPQPVHYVYQTNQGAYGARNTGLDRASGGFIAFFDSDDIWLAHHLHDCVAALQANPEVDWVYGACRVVDYLTGRVVAPSTFYVSGEGRPFLKLHARQMGTLRIIDDPEALKSMFLDGLYCGLQNSVIRRRLFENRPFQTAFRNEAEDQLVVLRMLAEGRTFAYIDQVNVIYHEHDANSSAAGSDPDLEKRILIYFALVRGYEELRSQIKMTPCELRAWRKRLSREYFWHLGYSLYWRHGRRNEAMSMFWQGIRLWPWDIFYWKTFLLARLRSLPCP
jgi:glycosyltransferase involved in cell wall biosynthesis